jgi:uncharacterized RDD family membrane protein YckC
VNQYRITTAQNVTIRLTIANMGDRILACIIDMLILGGYIFLVGYLFDKIEGHLPLFSMSNTGFWIYFLLNMPVYFYSLLFEYFMNGQTPGKKIRKIRVVRMDGESLTLGNCIIRWLFRLVDIWFDSGSVAIVTATFSKIHQRLGDMIAGTIVVNTHPGTEMDFSLYVHAESGEVRFPEVERLKLNDIQLVGEALKLYYEQDKFDYILMVSAQLKRVLEIMPEMDDLSFVKQIVSDYNLLHRVPLIES